MQGNDAVRYHIWCQVISSWDVAIFNILKQLYHGHGAAGGISMGPQAAHTTQQPGATTEVYEPVGLMLSAAGCGTSAGIGPG